METGRRTALVTGHQPPHLLAAADPLSDRHLRPDRLVRGADAARVGHRHHAPGCHRAGEGNHPVRRRQHRFAVGPSQVDAAMARAVRGRRELEPPQHLMWRRDWPRVARKRRERGGSGWEQGEGAGGEGPAGGAVGEREGQGGEGVGEAEREGGDGEGESVAAGSASAAGTPAARAKPQRATRTVVAWVRVARARVARAGMGPASTSATGAVGGDDRIVDNPGGGLGAVDNREPDSGVGGVRAYACPATCLSRVDFACQRLPLINGVNAVRRSRRQWLLARGGAAGGFGRWARHQGTGSPDPLRQPNRAPPGAHDTKRCNRPWPSSP